MTEDRQAKAQEIIEKKPSIWMTMTKVIVIGLFAVLVIASLLVGVLQISTFDGFSSHQAFDQSLAMQRKVVKYDDQGFSIKVEPQTLGYEMERMIRNQLSDSELQLESLTYNGEEHVIEMNFLLYGFYLPIAYEVEWSSDGSFVKADLMNPSLGKRKIVPPTWFINQLESFTGLADKKNHQIRISNYGLSESLELANMEVNSEGLILSFRVDEASIEEELTNLISHISEDLLVYYKTYSPDRTKFVVELVEHHGSYSSEQIQLLVNDVRGSQHIINDLILLTENYDTSGLTALLSAYDVAINEGRIDLERKAFKGQAIDDVIGSIFVALDDYFVERMLAFNQGKPYDLEAMETLTISTLNEIYDLGIEVDLLEALTFVYDEGFKVAYKLDEETYYIRAIERYDVVSKADYEAFLGANRFVEPSYVTDKTLWDEVTSFIKNYFGAEEVFVRYMKSDGQSTFAVISTNLNPQDYWSMALYKEAGVITLLEEDVKAVANLIADHPNFNVETATREIEKISFERLSNRDLDDIIDELYDIGIVSSIASTEILYSSFDGDRYIMVKLNNDKEYVIKVESTVYGRYIQTVYNKDRALSNWDGISELLTLQEIPE